MKLQAFAASIAAVAALAPTCASAAGDEDLWKLLKEGGQVVLMRHTLSEPGVGEPPNMRIDDCSTQRNLSESGRKHAKAIGEATRARGVQFDRVVSSPMCRCLDTAKLAFGHVDEQQHSGNPRAGTEDQIKVVRDLRAIATEKHRGGGNVVVISHARTIAAVTEISPGPGEMVVLTPHGDGKFEIRGRLMPAPEPK
jgi:phosphohistidine phosphatase SixA